MSPIWTPLPLLCYLEPVQKPLDIRDLGLVRYQPTWELQRSLQQQRIRDEIPDTLLLCEHHPVITAGTSTKPESLLVDEEQLAARGVDFFRVERGGDATYHGPGQLVAYPILNLNQHRRDVHWYMRTLEAVVISTVNDFGICAHVVPGRTGVWTAWGENANDSNDLRAARRKIASIGVRISRWCTMHGLALTISDLTAGFALINPCGFSDITATSLNAELALLETRERAAATRAAPLHPPAPLTVAAVQKRLIRHFIEAFGFKAG